MSIARSQLIRGPAKVTWNSVTLWSESDIRVPLAPTWDPIETSFYGRVDEAKRDLIITIPMRLWGAWENLSVLFPAALLNPTNGARLFGNSDLPLVLHSNNQDQLTIHNAQITRLADLYLGGDGNIFGADVEFTGLLKNSANPEDSGAYYTLATAAFVEGFAKTNHKRVRFTGAWGSKTGFTTITPQLGFNVSWQLGLTPDYVAGLGTLDMIIDGLTAEARCIPIGPTLAQILGESAIGTAHGTLASANAADLTLTGSGVSVVLKSAFMASSAVNWGRTPLRNGEVLWRTTRGFTAGTPAAVATVA